MKSEKNNLHIANQENINLAIEKIISGDIIVYPTDTLYSFGADATNSDAIIKLNKIKKRTSPLSIMLLNITDIKSFAEVDDNIMKKITNIMPGPFTVLLKSKNNPIISNYVQLNSKLIGIRIANNTFCNKLIKLINKPIITTSVNMHNCSPLKNIKDIKNQFPALSIFFTKNKLTSKGSTIIDFSVSPEKIIRLGDKKK